MKKAYITPAAEALEFRAEQMLAMSPNFDIKNGTSGAGESLSNERFWYQNNNSIWKD